MFAPLPYNDYGESMRRRLGGRIQKLAIEASLGCPNRSGKRGYGGCTFCRNDAFSPSYCRTTTSITEQIDAAIAFHHARRRKADIYLAYFQSGSNTYADIETLQQLYEEALSHPAINGLIVGTRPDCIDSQKLQLLEDISHRHYLAVEYGIESVYDHTLRHVNRGHDYASAVEAIKATRERDIDVGGHLIIGLPHESRAEVIESIEHINNLHLNFLKLHQLQIYKATPMADEWQRSPEDFLFHKEWSAEEYCSLIIDILRRLTPTTAIERFVSSAPRHLLLFSPLSGIRPDVIRRLVAETMTARGYKQGDLL